MSHENYIQNRHGMRVAANVEIAQHSNGLAFVMHGRSGHREQPHIKRILSAFVDCRFDTVTFDTTNSFGQSDGDFVNATFTNYSEDLADIIVWAKRQPWYQEPFVLAGHSLGAFCCAAYAETSPREVEALVLISPVVSGSLLYEAFKQHSPNEAENWKRTGWREWSAADGTTHKRLPWAHVEDSFRFDLLPQVTNLDIPVLVVVGDHDITTPLEHVQKLYDLLPGPKELRVIKGAPHTFKSTDELGELAHIVREWLRKNALNTPI